jgi:hypothetical protein
MPGSPESVPSRSAGHFRYPPRRTAFVALLAAGACVPPPLVSNDVDPVAVAAELAQIVCSSPACCETWFGSFDEGLCRVQVQAEMGFFFGLCLRSGGRLVPEEVERWVAEAREAAHTCLISSDARNLPSRICNGPKAPGSRCEIETECADPPDGWGDCKPMPLGAGSCEIAGRCRFVHSGGREGERCNPEGTSSGDGSCDAEAVVDLHVCDGAPGLYCDFTSERCRRRGVELERCPYEGFENPCADGFYCDVGSAFCRTKKQASSTCARDAECAGELVCISSVCTEPIPDGSPCSDASPAPCREGSFCQERCLPGALAVTREVCGQ